MAHKIIFLIFVLFFIFSPRFAAAHEGHYSGETSFITIVNPQRISEYTKGYLTSFQEELNQIESRGLSATWPVTYDVLGKKDFVDALKNMNGNQEVGIFLEITPQFAKDAGVAYNQSDSWHRANSLFTTGYTHEGRIKLIDTVFKKFKKKFGYYPTSVGAWYIDAFSLNYMQEKYGITATINMSDQYDLDGYQLWGTPWSVPYYPSSSNAAIPGDLEVLTLRWAPRDPLNGYHIDSEFTPSMYSLQDYETVGLPNSYFENLLTVYTNTNNLYSHAVIGLEGDLKPEAYTSYFSQRLTKLQNLQIQTLTMKDFAKWHKEHIGGNNLQIIASEDLLNQTNKKAYWIQNKNYRIGIVSNPDTNTSEVVDFRTYPKNLEEPFFKSPNKQHNLSINLPYIIDSVIQPKNAWNLELGSVKNIEKDKLIFEKGIIEFGEQEIVFPKNVAFPKTITSSPYLAVVGNKINTDVQYPTGQEGETYMDFSLDIPFTIKRRLPAFLTDIIPKKYLPIPQFYSISQTEMDALKVLKDLPEGNVLVFDRDCLDCGFHTKFKPATMAGKKGYVKKYSGKDVLEDLVFSTAKSSMEAKEELKNKDIHYIYLSKYEDYIEALPYLPQDLGLEKVYENANAEIWEVTSR